MEDEQPAREANKICGVCGDRALGHNFNAVSCESCKAFFRRNALKNKDFRCPFTENCNITPVTRRFCQKCRLDKCFAIGMRKDYIMSEEDKVLKRQKIEQNRAKKRPRSESGRPSKSRKSCSESYEDITVNSSTVSDTYFWESDRKYTDLDANRQNVTDSMSPVTGASVPSPSSPPESANIAGSKTLDMLRESSHGSSFRKYDESRYGDPESPRISSGSSVRISQINTLEEKKSSEQNTVDPSSRFDPVESPEYSPDYKTSYTNFVQSPVPPFIEYASKSKAPEGGSAAEGAAVCQKPKETCPKESNMISKFMHDPDLVIKLANNPNLIAKLFQDQSLMLKIITDPEVANKLENDPQIVQFLEENGATTEKEIDETEVLLKEDSKSFDGPKDVFRTKQSYIENPILTDLIANANPEERSNRESSSSNSSTSSSIIDWNKNVTDVTRDVLQDVQRIPILANSIESILCEAIKLEFSAYSALGGMQTRRELNDAERAKLNELIVANKALLAPLDEDITNLVGDECKIKSNFGKSDPVLLDVINLTAIAIRRLIKMAKKINAFKNMCQEDQIALLKGGSTEMMILRSAVNYDPERDMWRIPHTRESMSNIKADILKEAKGNLYAEHARFVGTFDPRWRDENIILILSAIALFTPDRPKVVHNDVIKLEQNSYYYLLRRYLESVYPGCEAKSMFLKLIQKISDLHRLNNEVVGVYLNVNPSCVEPLLIEIFDLKH